MKRWTDEEIGMVRYDEVNVGDWLVSKSGSHYIVKRKLPLGYMLLGRLPDPVNLMSHWKADDGVYHDLRPLPPGKGHRQVQGLQSKHGPQVYSVTVRGIATCGHPYHWWASGAHTNLQNELKVFPHGRIVKVGLCETCELKPKPMK